MKQEKLTEAIQNSFSIAEALKKMKMSVSTGNYRSFHKKIKEFGIDTSHFLGQSHLKGKIRKTKTTMTLDQILVENSGYSAIDRLKKRLRKNNVLPYECSICKISKWQDKELSLQLDHINGVHNDHRLNNLRFLCPNCHSQTTTFAGKNKKKGLPE